jgi:putative heme-binding domain-containing protein
VGYTFAPDISDSREKTPTQILTDILQPNRAVDANFFNYAALTYDGLTHDGILTAETPTSITLKQGEGKEVTLLREDVDQFASTGRSLMPEGLEKEISHQQMALPGRQRAAGDEIAIIGEWHALGGTPQWACFRRARPDGQLKTCPPRKTGEDMPLVGSN